MAARENLKIVYERLTQYDITDEDVFDMEALAKDLQALVSRRLNPLFRIHDVVVVDRLPRTASNKILRRELRREYLARGTGDR